MLRKLQFLTMALPVMAATWLCFYYDAAPAIPANMVVAVDLPDAATEIMAMAEQGSEAQEGDVPVSEESSESTER